MLEISFYCIKNLNRPLNISYATKFKFQYINRSEQAENVIN